MISYRASAKYENEDIIECSYKYKVFNLKSQLQIVDQNKAFEVFTYYMKKLQTGLFFNYYEEAEINLLEYRARKLHENKLRAQDSLVKIQDSALFTLDIAAIYGCVKIGDLSEIFNSNIAISFNSTCDKKIYNKTDYIFINNQFLK